MSAGPLANLPGRTQARPGRPPGPAAAGSRASQGSGGPVRTGPAAGRRRPARAPPPHPVHLEPRARGRRAGSGPGGSNGAGPLLFPPGTDAGGKVASQQARGGGCGEGARAVVRRGPSCSSRPGEAVPPLLAHAARPLLPSFLAHPRTGGGRQASRPGRGSNTTVPIPTRSAATSARKTSGQVALVGTPLAVSGDTVGG